MSQFWCENINCLMQNISFALDDFAAKCFGSKQKCTKKFMSSVWKSLNILASLRLLNIPTKNKSNFFNEFSVSAALDAAENDLRSGTSIRSNSTSPVLRPSSVGLASNNIDCERVPTPQPFQSSNIQFEHEEAPIIVEENPASLFSRQQRSIGDVEKRYIPCATMPSYIRQQQDSLRNEYQATKVKS